MLKWTQAKKDQLIEKYRREIRERAIQRTKARIAVLGKSVEDYSKEHLEIIVSDEEQKLKQEIKDKSLLGALALLGFSTF
jgi:hypothetical protein